MPVEISSLSDAAVFRNPGKKSVQIISPETSPDARITVTRVTMASGAVSARHIHARSEQTWIIEQGDGELLLTDGVTRAIGAGGTVRTPAGTEHGIANIGPADLIYLSITTPPEDMAKFYDEH